MDELQYAWHTFLRLQNLTSIDKNILVWNHETPKIPVLDSHKAPVIVANIIDFPKMYLSRFFTYQSVSRNGSWSFRSRCLPGGYDNLIDLIV